MTFNELRYLVAIAQEKSFGRAAQRCFVSQPALSVAIQKLEEELGTQIFERGKAEITVTPVGERIVEQAQKVLEEAAHIREIAQAGRYQLVGVFRLGVIYTVAPYLLPDLIPALNERAPQMPLEIEENVRNMVASGLGVSVLPRDALTPKYHSRPVVAVPFAKPVPSRRIALAYRKSFPRPAAIAAIREAVAVCRTRKAA